MNKKFIPAEKNLKKLLKDLSADKKPYPDDLLQARRASYLSHMTSVVSSGPQHTMGAQQGHSGSSLASAPMTPLMKVVLTVLMAANAALAAYLAISVYENWDTVRELLFNTPSVVEASPAPFEVPTQEPASVITPEFVPSLDEAVVPSATPEPASLSGDSQPSDTTAPDNQQVGPSELEESTPEPEGKDNPGLHLGQTPHGPGDPPGQDNQDDTQDSSQDDQDSDKGNDKDKKDKDNDP